MNAYYITVKGLRVYAYHGVGEQERRVGNDFSVDVRLRVEGIDAALASDNIADTVNYAEVVEVVKREMSLPSRLLEHVCSRIRNALVQRFDPHIAGGEITVAKLAPPISAQLDLVAFTLEW